LEEIYRAYQQRATFYIVYIREAHPTDGWQTTSNLNEGVIYEQTHTLDQRREVASACTIGLKLTLPTLIDSPDNAADRAYGGWPERLYVLSPTGHILYQGGKGPYGFDLEELDAFLKDHLPQ
jgi:hypothetical protein